MAEIPRPTLDDLQLPPGRSALLILDAVQDPGNFGTLVRTAEALGAAAAVVLPGTVDPWNPKAVRAAVGASFRIPMVAAEWDALAPRLNELDISVFAADAGVILFPVPFRRGLHWWSGTRARAYHRSRSVSPILE